MKNVLLFLALAVGLAAQSVPTTLQKNPASNTSPNRLTDPSKTIIVPNGGSISADSGGTIAATSVAGGSISPTAPLTGGGPISGTVVIGIPKATSLVDGYLFHTDWATFNAKQAALTFTAPIVNTSGTVAIAAATGSVNGYLTSADWTTFNAKQAAGSYLTALTGDATAAGPGSAAVTLATVNSNVGTFGGAAQSLTATVNGKGLVTAISSQAISIASTAINDSTATGRSVLLGTAQAANAVFAGPTSGGNAAPTFRALVAADVPSLSATYLVRANNLSDVASASTSARNIGLGTTDSPTFANVTLGSTGATKAIKGGANLVLVIEGDSLSDPAGHAPGSGPTSTWPYYLTHNATFPFFTAIPSGNIHNGAVSGSTVADIIARFNTTIAPYAPSAGQQTIAIIWIGHNDSDTLSAAAIYASLKTLWAMAKAINIDVVPVTITGGFATGADAKTTTVHDLNELIRGDPTLYFSGPVDLGGYFPVMPDKTYSQGDQHFGAYGNLQIATEMNRFFLRLTGVTNSPQGFETFSRYLASPYALFYQWGWIDGSNNWTLTTSTNGNLVLNPSGTGYTYARGNPFFADKIQAGYTTIPSAHNTATNVLLATRSTAAAVTVLAYTTSTTATAQFRMAGSDGAGNWNYGSVTFDQGNARLRVTSDDFGGGATIDLARGANAGITFTPIGNGVSAFTNGITSTGAIVGTRFGTNSASSSNVSYYNFSPTGSGFQDDALHSSTVGFDSFDARFSIATGPITVATATGFHSRENTRNSATVTTETGFYADSLSWGTTVYGFRGTVVSGSNKWNLYMDGTAGNYLAGTLQVDAGISIGGAYTSSAAVYNLKDLTGFEDYAQHSGSAWASFDSRIRTANGSTVTDAIGFQFREDALGTSSTIANMTGVWVRPITLASTNIYGVRSQVAIIGGKTTYNIYADGTAPNSLAGITTIANTTDAAVTGSSYALGTTGGFWAAKKIISASATFDGVGSAITGINSHTSTSGSDLTLAASGGVNLVLDHTASTGSASFAGAYIKMTPADVVGNDYEILRIATVTGGNMGLYFTDQDNGLGGRNNRVLNLGYNPLRLTSSNPAFTWKLESYYDTGSAQYIESYWQYINTSSVEKRPIMVQVNRATDAIVLSFEASSYIFGNGGTIGTLDASGNFSVAGGITTTGVTSSGGIVGTSLTAPASTDLQLVAGSTGASFKLGKPTASSYVLTPVNASLSAWGTSGATISVGSATYTDTSTAGSGTVATTTFTSFAQPTIAATNTSVTYTNATTVYIAGAPTNGTHATITNAYGLWNAGQTRLDQELIVGSGATTASNRQLAISHSGQPTISMQISGTENWAVFSDSSANFAIQRAGAGNALIFDTNRNATFGSGTVTASNATDASNTTTAAMVVTGGLALGKKLYVGDDVHAIANVSIDTAGKTLSVKSGSNAAAGTVTLVAGAATITSTAIDANTVILFSEKTAGGTPGVYQPLAAVSSGSAAVTSAATDTSTYNWVAMKVN